MVFIIINTNQNITKKVLSTMAINKNTTKEPIKLKLKRNTTSLKSKMILAKFYLNFVKERNTMNSPIIFKYIFVLFFFLIVSCSGRYAVRGGVYDKQNKGYEDSHSQSKSYESEKEIHEKDNSYHHDKSYNRNSNSHSRGRKGHGKKGYRNRRNNSYNENEDVYRINSEKEKYEYEKQKRKSHDSTKDYSHESSGSELEFKYESDNN